MKALSIRQPWAWLILYAGKDIENRNWHPAFRGRFLIHAAKGMTHSEYAEACDFAMDINPQLHIPLFHEIERGGIVGSVKLVDVVRHSDSPWFCGKFGFVLSTPFITEFKPLKGQLGFFEVTL